jgi:tetratricopeptide (TPR) repeat protein
MDILVLIRSILLVLLIFMTVAPQAEAGWEGNARAEIALTAGDFQKLDTFEGHLLAKADQVYAQKDYRGALANYSAFMEQYPKSTATAYVLLRRGRCLDLDNKRFEAIKAYNEVLDYFPNAFNYASAALFYIGLGQFQNGDVVAAVKAWTELVQDEDYRKSDLAAEALCRVGDLFMTQNKADEAAKYYIQATIDFRKANPAVARYTLEQALTYLIRTRPDEAKLADLYQKAFAFGYHPGTPTQEGYWISMREAVRRLGVFTESEKPKRQDYYRYWAGAMAGKFPQDDDFQLDLADFQRLADGDEAKWVERVERQFAAYQKPGNHSRVIRWIRAYGGNKAKVQEYYSKLNFGSMTNGDVEVLIKVLCDYVKDLELARNTYGKLQQGKWTDADRTRLGDFVMLKDEVLMARVCADMTDKDFGRMRLMRYYHWQRMPEKALLLANDLVGVPAYAKEAYWMKAEMLQQLQKYPEAISAYQSCDRPPASLFAIAACFQAQGKTEQALAQLREVEGFFKDAAPEAAMRIARIYRDLKDTKQYVANLRGIMKKYPQSGQSSVAHEELERLGFKIGGGVDAS